MNAIALRGTERAAEIELSADVGDSIARHRRRRGLDLDTLAERSDLPIDLLALLEAGQAVPDLRTVWAIATALDVPFAALLARTGVEPSTFRIVRGARGRVVASGSGRFRSCAVFPLGDPYAPEVYELTSRRAASRTRAPTRGIRSSTSPSHAASWSSGPTTGKRGLRPATRCSSARTDRTATGIRRRARPSPTW